MTMMITGGGGAGRIRLHSERYTSPALVRNRSLIDYGEHDDPMSWSISRGQSCSGVGEWSANETCLCRHGYLGDDCQYKVNTDDGRHYIIVMHAFSDTPIFCTYKRYKKGLVFKEKLA